MEEENVQDYIVKGGYLRVAIGDRLGPGGRYVVKRKLGYVLAAAIPLPERCNGCPSFC